MTNSGYLMIESTGNGFWHDMHHVLDRLYAAEQEGRVPVVCWGRNCMYSASGGGNAFEQFFMPVSEYAVSDLPDPGPEACAPQDRACPDRLPGHLSGDIYREMLRKYIRLRPWLAAEIDSFHGAHMAGRPFIAAHIRGSDKLTEVSHLDDLNALYPCEIDRYLAVEPSAGVFLMTDCSDILEEYRERYGGILVHTDCKRVRRYGTGVHFQYYPDKMQKGVEIVRDTWLAAKCDYFIGNRYSNVSRAVSELKDWKDANIRLLR